MIILIMPTTILIHIITMDVKHAITTIIIIMDIRTIPIVILMIITHILIVIAVVE
jgi:hypothetical protein